MNTQVKRVIDEYNKAFGQDILEADIYVFKAKVYLSTAKVAKLLNVVPHYFSVIVSKEITAKVHMIHQGRNKWYRLKEVVSLYKKSIEKGVTVVSLCKI